MSDNVPLTSYQVNPAETRVSSHPDAKGLPKQSALGDKSMVPVTSARRWLRAIAPCQPLDAVKCTDVLAGLHSTGTELALEIRASHLAINVGLGCDAQVADEVARAIWGAAPEWEIVAGSPPPAPTGSLRLVCLMQRGNRLDWAPLRDLRTFAGADPLAAILEAVQPLAEDEQLLIRYLVRPARAVRQAKAQQELTVPAPPERLADLIPVLLNLGPKVPRFEAALQKALERRLAEPAFEVLGAVALAGSDPSRLKSRARSLTAVFAGRFGVGFGGPTLESWSWRAGPDNLPVVWRDGDSVLYLTTGELTALWHPPANGVLVPGISHVRRPSSLLPLQVERAQGLLLGIHRQRGREVPAHLPRLDLEAGHAVVIGRTGVGKSTLIHQLLRQLVAAPDHPGVGLVDPHGDLALDVAACGIPPEREADVALLDLGDVDFPVGLPLFWAPPEVPREALIETTFSLLKLIFREHWSPTRMEDAVFAVTATLCQLPGATLLDVPRLFRDPGFRRRGISGLDDQVARDFWQDYEQLSAGAQRELARPVLYRLRALYRSRAMRNLLCQPKGLDFVELADRGRIVLVSLAGPAIQAEADLLGELVIARLHLAAMARLARPREERQAFYLAVDESQRFQGGSLPILLSEGRKLRFALILSTQFLDAWGEALANSVLGNIGAVVAFRSGPNDSRRLSASLKPFTPDQLEDLDRYEAIVKLQVDGATMPAFDVLTIPIDAPHDEAALARIRGHARRQYARPRAEVEAEIQSADPYFPGTRNHHDVDEE